MADVLFYKIINNEIDFNQFMEWLLKYESNSKISNEITCNQADFLGYFLNIIHQGIPNYCSKWGGNLTKTSYNQQKSSESSDTTIEMNKSHSFPLDLSNNSCNSDIKTSTPKMLKTTSDSSINGSYMSPVSPLYQQNPIKQPSLRKSYHEKSPICLGDFIVNKRFSSSSIKKKSRFNNNNNNNNSNNSDDNNKLRRIKPTNLTEKLNNCDKYENSFNFLQTNDNLLNNNNNSNNDSLLMQNQLRKTPTTIIKLNNFIEIEPKFDSVTYQQQFDKIIKIYINLINNSFIFNIINEINFLIILLVKKQYKIEHDSNINDDNCIELFINDLQQLFNTIHNLIYFVTNVLQSQIEIFTNFDHTTLKLLIENQRLIEFVPDFVVKLQQIYNEQQSTITTCTSVTTTTEMTVCFNIDTDNRENFPNDLSFHSFRKQRDLFYEILHIWELQHLNNEWNFALSLNNKIRTLLRLCNNESMNFLHLARLFKLQLLYCCNNNNSGGGNQQQLQEVVANLPPMDIDKFNRLKTRLTTQDSSTASSITTATTSTTTTTTTTFIGREVFFKDFILTANNYCFNRHLCDTLICEIVELNETNFNCTDLGDVKEIQLDLSTKRSFLTCIKSLRLLAKLLGFIESLPYEMNSNLTQNLVAQCLKVRGQVLPNFDIKTILEESIKRKSLILCIPWLTVYLSMLDYVTLRLPYYRIIGILLMEIYKNYYHKKNNLISKKNHNLIKYCLGYLFDLKQYPINEYDNNVFIYEKQSTINGQPQEEDNNNQSITIDNLDIIDQNLFNLCCPNLNNIKKLLINNSNNNNSNNNNNEEQNIITIKHVTPVTTLQTIADMNLKRLQQQLEETFLNSQTITIRKTIEFVSERVASICCKYLINIIIPKYKQLSIEKFNKFLIDNNINQQQQQQYVKNDKQLLLIENYKLNILKELQYYCYNDIIELCTKKITLSIDTLISLDVLQQTKDVCCNIATKTCLERIKQWISSHVTIAIFSKDFDEIINKLKFTTNNNDNGGNDDNKKRNKPFFGLPPDGNNNKHNEDTVSAAHLLEKLQNTSITIIENHQIIDDACIMKLLDDILKSIKERGDINECILSTICTTLVDLALLLVAHKSELMVNSVILIKMYEIWQLYYLGTNQLFKQLLCQRNIMLFGQSKNIQLTWLYFAKFCVFLVQKDLLNCDNFETQCTGLFRTEWDQCTLKLITDFLKEFVRLYRNEGGGSATDFTFLLNFLSDYCEDL